LAALGLAEVENRGVVEDLLSETPLSGMNYHILHKESKDFRGIDVALLYNPELFSPYATGFHKVVLPDTNRTTRDMLLTSGTIKDHDTIHMIVCHWPSRYSGQLKSEPSRMAAAQKALSLIDSIRSNQPHAKVLLMGDLNDEPQDKSVSKTLGASKTPDSPTYSPAERYNLSSRITGSGTHKHQGHWGVLDQLIVTTGFFSSNSGIRPDLSGPMVFTPDFMMESDATHTGQKPFRTFVGFKYNGGYSDHLPVYLDLQLLQREHP
jgi:predicted extracellular nuclease